MTTCSSRNAGRFRAGPLWVKSARLDDYELDWKRKVVGNIRLPKRTRQVPTFRKNHKAFETRFLDEPVLDTLGDSLKKALNPWPTAKEQMILLVLCSQPKSSKRKHDITLYILWRSEPRPPLAEGRPLSETLWLNTESTDCKRSCVRVQNGMNTMQSMGQLTQ